MAILQGVEVLRLPTLPNAAWFFFASPHNHLSLRNDLPGVGALASTFCSPRIPTPLLLLGAPFLPLLYIPGAASLVRRMGRRVIKQDAVSLTHPPTDWNTYEIEWELENVSFAVDGQSVLETQIVPEGPLGLVIWVDNQYASLPPRGRPAFGTLANPEPAWIEISEIKVQRLPVSSPA